MLRSPWITTIAWLCLSASAASAQDAAEAEGAPEPAADAPPEPAPVEPQEPAAPEEPPPVSEPAEPEPVPPPPPPPPPPARARYEGEVESSGNANAYEASEAYEEPEEEPSGDDGGGIPGFSIRLDPFNWLLEGRLGLELEVVAWEFISVELVPVFVANTEPPSFNFSGREDSLSQHSNGIGPISGASLGAGFWLSGEPLRGYVLRVMLTNYGYDYEASDSAGVFDRVTFTERRFVVFFGSHNRWGAFTLAGGIGLGYELNQQQRCFVNSGAALASATSGCPDDGELHIKLNREASEIADLNGGFHPIYLAGRISLGVTFD